MRAYKARAEASSAALCTLRGTRRVDVGGSASIGAARSPPNCFGLWPLDAPAIGLSCTTAGRSSLVGKRKTSPNGGILWVTCCGCGDSTSELRSRKSGREPCISSEWEYSVSGGLETLEGLTSEIPRDDGDQNTGANPDQDLDTDLDRSPDKSRKVSPSASGGALSGAKRSLFGRVTLSALNGTSFLHPTVPIGVQPWMRESVRMETGADITSEIAMSV